MLQELNPAVVGITETHLKNDMELTFAGYEWVGENNREAIRGSRGVALLNYLRQAFKVQVDFILWISIYWHVSHMNLGVSYFYTDWPSFFYQHGVMFDNFIFNSRLN